MCYKRKRITFGGTLEEARAAKAIKPLSNFFAKERENLTEKSDHQEQLYSKNNLAIEQESDCMEDKQEEPQTLISSREINSISKSLYDLKIDL